MANSSLATRARRATGCGQVRPDIALAFAPASLAIADLSYPMAGDGAVAGVGPGQHDAVVAGYRHQVHRLGWRVRRSGLAFGRRLVVALWHRRGNGGRRRWLGRDRDLHRVRPGAALLDLAVQIAGSRSYTCWSPPCGGTRSAPTCSPGLLGEFSSMVALSPNPAMADSFAACLVHRGFFAPVGGEGTSNSLS